MIFYSKVKIGSTYGDDRYALLQDRDKMASKWRDRCIKQLSASISVSVWSSVSSVYALSSEVWGGLISLYPLPKNEMIGI